MMILRAVETSYPLLNPIQSKTLTLSPFKCLAAVLFVSPQSWSTGRLLSPLSQRLMDVASKIGPFRGKMHPKRTFARVFERNPIADQF